MKYGNSLVVQWLGLCTFTAEDPGSIPGRETKIPQAEWCGQKKKKKVYAIIGGEQWQMPNNISVLGRCTVSFI